MAEFKFLDPGRGQVVHRKSNFLTVRRRMAAGPENLEWLHAFFPKKWLAEILAAE